MAARKFKNRFNNSLVTNSPLNAGSTVKVGVINEQKFKRTNKQRYRGKF